MAGEGIWYQRYWTASGARTYAVTDVDVTKKTLTAAFNFSSTTDRTSARQAVAMHVTTPVAFLGKVERDVVTGLATTQTVDSGSFQAVSAVHTDVKMTVMGLVYDLTRSDLCWPIAGTASFTLADAAGNNVAWSFDFAKAAAAPIAVADSGESVQLEPGFCLRR